MIKVIIVDDHVLFREGIKAILGSEPDIAVIGLAGTVAEAVDIVVDLRPDIVLMDLNLPDGTGVDATTRILLKYPQGKIVFLTMSEHDEDLFQAVRSGAKGYLLKSLQPSKLVNAIRSVQQGESALSSAMTMRLMEELSRSRPAELPVDPRLAALTNRELDVLREVACGKSNQEIAAVFSLAENTIKYHIHSLLGKLNLPDRKSLAAFALEHGILKGKR